MTAQFLSRLLLLALLIAASGAHAENGPTVFAAASTKTALDAIAEVWKAKTGKPLVLSYASSGTLARQIESGAPADMFISADLKWMEGLDKDGLVQPGTKQNLLGNTLVLVEPTATPKNHLAIAKGFDLAGALGDSRLAVCTVTSCPGGMYGKEALENLGIWPAVMPKLAEADNVRAALLLVARGEARYGIVYGTDAHAEPRVRVVGIFPEDTHTPVVYPVALLKGATNPSAAAFETFLRGPEAVGLLKKQGFEILP